jgi:TonB family protein
LTRPDRLRVAAAFCVSLLAHAAVLSLLRPTPPAPVPVGSSLSVLLVPVPGERRAESASTAVPSKALPPAEKGVKPAVREREAQAAAPSAPETRGRRRPWVSASPDSPPRELPRSRRADAAEYLAPEAQAVPPRFEAPFEMQFPRKALEEGRRGVVLVQLLIDEDGRVVEALAIPDAPKEFADAAVAGLSAARFRPAQAGGRPVKARAYFSVSFVLE